MLIGVNNSAFSLSTLSTLIQNHFSLDLIQTQIVFATRSKLLISVAGLLHIRPRPQYGSLLIRRHAVTLALAI